MPASSENPPSPPVPPNWAEMTVGEQMEWWSIQTGLASDDPDERADARRMLDKRSGQRDWISVPPS